MKLIALLCWWNEPLRNLESSITAAAEVGVTHLAALDGAYAALDAKPLSSPGQAKHIRKVCKRHGIVCVVDAIEGATEIEKRTALFDLAYRSFQPTPDDWFLIHDADTTITPAGDIKQFLSTVTEDACTTLVYEGDESRFDETTQRRLVRFLMRCNPGLHVGPANHYTYTDGKGRVVWGLREDVDAAEAPIVLHNNSTNRSAARVKKREDYYLKRRQQGLEQHSTPTCDVCPEYWTVRLPTGFKVATLADGSTELVSESTAFRCPEHADEVLTRNRHDLYRIGNGNPDAVDELWRIMLKGSQTRSLSLP